MDSLEFSKEIPAVKVAEVIKDFFEQHMLVYYMLKGIKFVAINDVTIDTASIMYSLQVLDDRDKDNIAETLNNTNTSIYIYGKEYKPTVFVNGDLLCITVNR